MLKIIFLVFIAYGSVTSHRYRHNPILHHMILSHQQPVVETHFVALPDPQRHSNTPRIYRRSSSDISFTDADFEAGPPNKEFSEPAELAQNEQIATNLKEESAFVKSSFNNGISLKKMQVDEKSTPKANEKKTPALEEKKNLPNPTEEMSEIKKDEMLKPQVAIKVKEDNHKSEIGIKKNKEMGSKSESKQESKTGEDKKQNQLADKENMSQKLDAKPDPNLENPLKLKPTKPEPSKTKPNQEISQIESIAQQIQQDKPNLDQQNIAPMRMLTSRSSAESKGFNSEELLIRFQNILDSIQPHYYQKQEPSSIGQDIGKFVQCFIDVIERMIERIGI